MGRGRYPARLKVGPPSLDLAARYLQIWSGRELYLHPEHFPPLSSAGLFGNDRPLELDIGCASGDLLLFLATRQPATNYVGLEILAKPLWLAVKRAAAAGLDNLRLIQADSRLVYRQIPDGALHMAYMHFPAPLLRNRQRRQLLVSAELLAQLERCLVPGGRFSFMTDQPALAAHLDRLLLGAPALRPVHPEEASLELSEVLKSHYQRRWEARGRPILRVELLRDAAPPVALDKT